eukprot:CAMPEP_0175165030 /NCGR_PEP_ID=MMETSP0087-20121206/26806_1 /TAXON_ID=136419 /ORGANISM="Unknown Unknown, Strain D1" /LENGTH=179 /DNA_ID=CAMNT_0016454255 /DNA_START=18 /DNA_END=554 /DNA_ORIENTATION=+
MKAEKAENVQLYDMGSHKHCLDNAVKQFMVDKKQLSEDTRASNYKLIMGFVGTVIALMSQFYPMPFPECRPILAVGVVVYFILHSAISYIMYKEGNTVFQSVPKHEIPGLNISTHMFCFEVGYYVTISKVVNGELIDKEEKELKINNFFDTEGDFLKEPFFLQLDGILTEYLKTTKKEK